MRKSALLLFSIFFVLATLTTAASAGKETLLSQERLTQRTAIYGNYVFWTESTANAVHTFNLTTGQRTDIEGHYAIEKINSYGNKFVWTGEDGDAVYMYDISTGNETSISSAGRLPDIYGNYVVYTNNYYYGEDHQNDSIYLYDLNAHKETKIANVYSSPAIYDTKVVWSQANSNNDYEIREFDISTNKTSIITTTNSSIPESELDIYRNIVVWIESGNVYMYDVASHRKTQVTNSGNASQPAIYGNRIVYTLGNPSADTNTDIYMYEISNASTTRITSSTKAFGPSIYEDKIAYTDWRNSPPETSEVRDIYLYDLNPENEKPKAIFITSITAGNAPLNVSFNDISSGKINSWYWNFGDGTNSTEQNPTHTYSTAGTYIVNLTVSDANSSDSKSATITVLGKTEQTLPIANFDATPTGGYAPLDVQFTDKSQNATAWNWDFGDGTNSTNQNPLHIYSAEGTYNVNLTVSNSYGAAYKNAIITVGSDFVPCGCILRDSHSGGGGGISSSPEPQSNVEIKDHSQIFISSGTSVKFDFPQNTTPVLYLSFNSKKTAGKTIAIVEMLKAKSTMVSGVPADEVYKYLNIWVGNSGFATQKNIENAIVSFKVAKSWVQDKKIDKTSITLNRYSDNVWNTLPTSLLNEDENYLYLTASTPEFSYFVITGKSIASGTIQPVVDKTQNPTVINTQKNTSSGSTAVNTEKRVPQQKANSSSSEKGSTKTPGFEAVCGILSLLVVIMYKKK